MLGQERQASQRSKPVRIPSAHRLFFGCGMKSIWYLLNLTHRSVVDTFEGEGDAVPKDGDAAGERLANETGNTFALARGKLFFQPDPKVEQPKVGL